MALYMRECNSQYVISVYPEGDETVPRLPFLQPGNYYSDIEGNQYRILRSTMDELQRGHGDGKERYYSWEYIAELEG
jgi:hypothetical protein